MDGHRMKQYVIINNELKMSKGKIARMCLSAGTQASSLIGWWQLTKWKVTGQVAVVLKADHFNQVIFYLQDQKIKYHMHVDAGLTQVPRGSQCSVTFFHDGNEELNKYKLY